MPIEIKGAKEHNLNIDQLKIKDGLTVVTGVSGSGKSSLVSDIIYHEANRIFHEAFGLGSKAKFAPSLVDEINGLRPTIAIDQNVLNRNPNSTVTTSSGLHPLFRILYARFGNRFCPTCNSKCQIFTKDEVVQIVLNKCYSADLIIKVPIIKHQDGPFDTLLTFLRKIFHKNNIEIITEESIDSQANPVVKSNIFLLINILKKSEIFNVRKIVNEIDFLGFQTISIETDNFTWSNSCANCGNWLPGVEPKIFHTVCPHCKGKKCSYCNFTGLHPLSNTIFWKNLTIHDLLELTIKEANELFTEVTFQDISERLQGEITKRLQALVSVGLDYLNLNRSMPTLSRGEAQRVRLALVLINNLEDMQYIFDEPTIGLHIKNVLDIIPEFRKLKGSTIFIEHDRIAASSADYAIDIGPGAGSKGGTVVFNGTISDLWKSTTTTGKFFSNSIKVSVPKLITKPELFLSLTNCSLRNLKGFDLSIPFHQLTVVTGVSGSGKTTLIKDVVVASLLANKPIGCKGFSENTKKVILVDQSPIGKNPRSNPATYTKLADLLREAFASKTSLPASYFSFNSKDGACPECNGLGSIEVKLTYLPSTWIVCEVCQGKKFNETVLEAKIDLDNKEFSFDDILSLSIEEVSQLLLTNDFFDKNQKISAMKIFKALNDIGLGYLRLGQTSPTLSGGEAQRIKLAKFLGKKTTSETILVLDEPSTGLHPADISGLLIIFNRLLKEGATIIVIEHNSDIIKAADWIVDLGPGSGTEGGELLYSGKLEGLISSKSSITNEMLKIEPTIIPSQKPLINTLASNKNNLVITHAKVNNLKDITVEFPKNAISIITGVSGSGKSSLISDIIEIEAKRRFLESLSMYERQSIHERAEVEATVEGLGVTFSVQAKKERYYLRNTVGFTTDITHQLAIIFSGIGVQYCEICKTKMKKQNFQWICSTCDQTYDLATPRSFSSRNYSSACLSCHGVGSKSVPNKSKLIIDPSKPICKGAMYSPGFFPKGYLCKEGNGGYYWLRALADFYNFNPEETPWDQMTEDAQNAFLYGSDDLLQYESFGLTGHSHAVGESNRGFYGFIREWDIGGTYTDRIPCKACSGAGLRPQFVNIRIKNKNFIDIHKISLEKLIEYISSLEKEINLSKLLQISFEKINSKLSFLCKVGLQYLNLQRTMGTLSAGEAQRIKLAGLLGSNLQGLTIILDEPTRGMHPSEVNELISALHQLKTRNNTLLVIEHDLDVIRTGDYLIELGPKSGHNGGQVINKGNLSEFCKNLTPTAKWLQNKTQLNLHKKVQPPTKFLTLTGARENNLKGDTLEIPLECLVGICGVSGSGKSTLLIDTLARIIAPLKHTTSVAYEPIQPGEYDSIDGLPDKAVIIDQVKKGMSNPMIYLGLNKILTKMFKESDDFLQSELDEKIFDDKCSHCKGEGVIKTDMGFLPPIYSHCDTCSGTGLIEEVWSIKLHGYSLPEFFSKTIDEIAELNLDSSLQKKLQMMQNLGLGYLVLKQPLYSLSGGEIQRLKIVKELSKKTPKETLFILDEPTLGLHLEDIKHLMNSLRFLVKNHNTVVIIEHNTFVLAQCDWLIELGPSGGEKGGYIINAGPILEFLTHETPTISYLKELLE